MTTATTNAADALAQGEIVRIPCNANDPDRPSCTHCGDSGPHGRLARYRDLGSHPTDLGAFCDDLCFIDHHDQ